MNCLLFIIHVNIIICIDCGLWFVASLGTGPIGRKCRHNQFYFVIELTDLSHLTFGIRPLKHLNKTLDKFQE